MFRLSRLWTHTNFLAVPSSASKNITDRAPLVLPDVVNQSKLNEAKGKGSIFGGDMSNTAIAWKRFRVCVCVLRESEREKERKKDTRERGRERER